MWQAARYRVYAFDQDGKVLGELDDKNHYTLKWTVHVANKKGAWVMFRGQYRPESWVLRNSKVQGWVRFLSLALVSPLLCNVIFFLFLNSRMIRGTTLSPTRVLSSLLILVHRPLRVHQLKQSRWKASSTVPSKHRQKSTWETYTQTNVAD
jgi:hypothetical protein